MRKIVLHLALLCLPFFVSAQNRPTVYKDFNKSGRRITSAFKINDHVWVLETWMEKESFELAAVDDQMQVLWRTTIDGAPLGAGKFKGHILAISASKISTVKGEVQGPYTAFLIDEKTGKLLTSRVIFDRKSDTREFPEAFFNEDGSNFTFVVRQSKQGTVLFGYPTKLNTIQELAVVKLDESLSSTISKLKFPDEDVINLTCNNKGDLFLVTHAPDDKVIKAIKYEAPKFELREPVTVDMDVHDESDLKDKWGELIASVEDGNILYSALIHRNKDRDDELTVSKFNFSDRTSKAVNEPLTRSHIKAIEKAYVPFDKNQDKPDIGPRGLRGKYITERNGTVVVVISNQNGVSGTYTSYSNETSLIINGYDANLNPKFQQLMPTSYNSISIFALAAHSDNNSLYMLANTATGLSKFTSYYGQLDLATGNWLKLEKLSKKELTGILSSHVMWFANGFIIPYETLGISGDHVSLQLNPY